MNGSERAPSTAILTVPNLITFTRLGLVPVFVWLGFSDHLAAAFAVGAVAGATDWIDGRIARRFKQVSELGIAIDPLSDRFLIAAAAAILIGKHFAPLWAVLLVLARDGLVLLAVPFLATRGVPRPAVNFIGKSATMGIMGAFGFLIGAHIRTPQIKALEVIAWVCYVPGVIFSYVSAGMYAMIVRRSLRSAPRERAG